MLQRLQTTTTTAVDDVSHRFTLPSKGSVRDDDSLSELEAILAKIATPDKDGLDAIKQATERQTLDDKVAQETDTKTPQRDHALSTHFPGYGDQAESYTLTLPGYKDGRDTYKIDYDGESVNHKRDGAYIETEVGEEGFYEAAVAVAEQAMDGREGAAPTQELSQETRQRQQMFKMLHPTEWLMMNENRVLLGFYKTFMC